MKIILFILLLTGFLFTSVYAEDNTLTESITSLSQTTQPPSAENKWYYGGSIGFSFWNDYTYIGIYPQVGYKVTPKFSVGAKIGYSYINYNDIDYSTNNYGGSIFTRYRVIPQFYLHSEFVYFSYEQQTYNEETNQFESGRNWVPYLLLGGGFSQQVGSNVWAYAEILFDVIQDENSPYKEWDPFVSFGVGVGF